MMRPSSSHSEAPDRDAGRADGPRLFEGVLAAGPVHAATDDRAWLQAMLDAEAALARARARVGLATPEEAEAVAAACRAEEFDAAALARDATAAGNPVVPLVRALRAKLPPGAARQAHAGATSQDIVDTAAMLVAHRATGPLRADLAAAADRAATLASQHRDTPVAGRTLLQQALPTTFGLVAAGWMTALDAAGGRLARVRHGSLAAQLGGAAGTLAAAGDGRVGPALLGAFADELNLNEPILPWHTDRGRIAELAGALGAAAGTAAKIARDVILSAQTEVGELREAAGRGGSSTMPHKANPVAAISAAASAARAPGLVADLLAAMAQEHQRAAGGWHAEWLPLTDLLRATGSAAHWLRDCLSGLRVDAGRMRANLDLTGGALLAERVSEALAGTLGRDAAHDLVAEAVRDGRLGDDPRLIARLGRGTLAELLDPAGYLGSAGALVDRALAAHPKGEI